MRFEKLRLWQDKRLRAKRDPKLQYSDGYFYKEQTIRRNGHNLDGTPRTKNNHKE